MKPNLAAGRRMFLAAALLSLLAHRSGAQKMGTLESLTEPRAGRVAHYSSHDLKGGNADFRRVAPGETLTLMEHQGPGEVRRFWLTIAPRNNREIQRQAIVRCYWDGETDPSVEAPVSDFFGMGFGEWRDFISLPLNMTSGGYNCYWPMPFAKSARITIENRSKIPIDAFYYNVDVETNPRLARPLLYFHAQFRRTNPTVRGTPVTLLETTGRGHYVGTLLSIQRVRGRGIGFLEGDERVFVDGETTPSIIGTGTEDYFSSGWYYDTGVYSAPYHGVTIKDVEKSRINTYRWHIEDPIPFTKSLKFTIEHGGVNDTPGVDYTSVAYWYQTHPKPAFPPLPRDLLPVEPQPIPRIAGLVEGEALVPRARATEGMVSVQDMGDWTSGDWSGLGQLWWLPKQSGSRLTLTLNAPEAKEYELVGYFTRARDYGDVRLTVNGQALTTTVHGYNPEVIPTGPVSFGRVPLKAGANEVIIEVVGKDTRSAGFLVGLDGFLLKP